MASSSLDRIHSLNAVIEVMDDDIDQARAELGMLEHIDDDVQRDAAVTEHAEDRQDARMTASDVARMTKHITRLERKREKTVQKRDAALAKLQAG
jgi:hypothetical protein